MTAGKRESGGKYGMNAKDEDVKKKDIPTERDDRKKKGGDQEPRNAERKSNNVWKKLGSKRVRVESGGGGRA